MFYVETPDVLSYLCTKCVLSVKLTFGFQLFTASVSLVKKTSFPLWNCFCNFIKNKLGVSLRVRSPVPCSAPFSVGLFLCRPRTVSGLRLQPWSWEIGCPPPSSSFSKWLLATSVVPHFKIIWSISAKKSCWNFDGNHISPGDQLGRTQILTLLILLWLNMRNKYPSVYSHLLWILSSPFGCIRVLGGFVRFTHKSFLYWVVSFCVFSFGDPRVIAHLWKCSWRSSAYLAYLTSLNHLICSILGSGFIRGFDGVF